MSRENSTEDLASLIVTAPSPIPSPPFPTQILPSSTEAGPSRPRRSPSSTRPLLSLNIRNSSFSPSSLSPGGRSPISPIAEMDKGQAKGRAGLKRRVSTPVVSHLQLVDEDHPFSNPGSVGPASPIIQTPSRTAAGETKSRARATSTSLVVPSLLLDDAAPTISVPPSPSRQAVAGRPIPFDIALPKPQLTFTSPSPDEEHPDATYPNDPPLTFLDRVYNSTETSLRRFTSLIRPSTGVHSHPLHRRGSDDESEKGLLGNEAGSTGSNTTRSNSDESERATAPPGGIGRYWGIWASEERTDGQDGYFSLPPTPPDHAESAIRRPSQDFEDALLMANGNVASLPTPALSAHSLSQTWSSGAGRRRTSPERMRMRVRAGEGWLRGVLSGWVGGAGRGKTGMVIRDLGWTVGVLILGFFVSLGLALWLLKGLPITTLRHLPKSTTDVKLLSAEIRTYMSSSDVGWWHTIGVLTFVGCWKHAWSVPGAIVLNILVGSLLSPIPALILLTIITATGSLGSYLLSRPLAPLIAVLFPKPLSLVRAALAPESSSLVATENDSNITPIHISSDPASPAIGASPKPNVWRRLLIMRAMGFVPWSGMNVACGVVGVDWKIFWLTTAAGSASWSYTTASIGDLLARLAVPSTVSTNGTGIDADPSELQGESLTAMLRDPVLIAKLVFLTALTLIPVLLKRSKGVKPEAMPTSEVGEGRTVESMMMSEKVSMESMDSQDSLDTISSTTSSSSLSSSSSPISPESVLSRSLARFTPTPAVFDVLSFGRTALRTGIGAVGNGARQIALTAGRIAGK